VSEIEVHGRLELLCMLDGAFDWWCVCCWGLPIILVAVVCVWLTLLRLAHGLGLRMDWACA